MITLGLGRRFSRIIRVILQKILIVSKSSTATKLERRFSFQHGKVILTDTITTTEKNFTKIYVPTDFTAIYVATGQAFTTSTLMPWQNYSSETETLNKTGKLTIARNF